MPEGEKKILFCFPKTKKMTAGKLEKKSLLRMESHSSPLQIQWLAPYGIVALQALYPTVMSVCVATTGWQDWILY